MGITKKHIYTESQIALAELFKALAHPARIAIIENLLAHPDSNCNDLRNYIQLAQSTISGHIKELHRVGILALKVVGSNAYYLLHKVALEPMTGYLEQLYAQIDKSIQSDRSLVYFKPQPYISPHHFKNQT